MKKILLLAAVTAFAFPAFACDDGAPHSAMEKANHKMMQAMDIKPTGDADKDFVAMMIPHHQGAIDMARATLGHAKDPDIIKLCKGIIAAQTREIAQMRVWQGAHP